VERVAQERPCNTDVQAIDRTRTLRCAIYMTMWIDKSLSMSSRVKHFVASQQHTQLIGYLPTCAYTKCICITTMFLSRVHYPPTALTIFNHARFNKVISKSRVRVGVNFARATCCSNNNTFLNRHTQVLPGVELLWLRATYIL
jgi:hypothetical protein